MGVSADRASGAFFFLFGLGVYFLIIPSQVEIVEGGNLAPSTMPNLIAGAIAVCGAILVIKPTGFQTQNLRGFMVTGVFAGILAASVYAMSLFGFVYVAPPLALAIMWVIGERRPLWLGAGTVLIPFLIWFLVTYPLGRALP